MKAYIRATKTVKAKDVVEELKKLRELIKDIPGARIEVEEVKDD